MQTCKQQVEEFKSLVSFTDSKIEKFYGVDGYDVYNPTVPFIMNGKKIIGARVEARDCENSRTMFFESSDDGWKLIENTTPLNMQDPSIAFVDGEIVVSGIEYPIPVKYKGEEIAEGWVQRFYTGKDLFSLKHIADGPALMKDIRMCQLNDGRLCFFTRPLEPVKGIGMVIFNSWEDFSADAMQNEPTLNGHFLPDEWGGANQIIVLDDDTLGVVGHKCYSTGEGDSFRLHYNSMAFTIKISSRQMTPLKIIATRSMFPNSPAKWKKCEDVIFTSGVEKLDNQRAKLYTGVSDCKVGSVIIDYPF